MKWIIRIVFLSLPFTAMAENTDHLEINKSMYHQESIGKYMSFLEDSENNLRESDVLSGKYDDEFKNYNKASNSFGFGKIHPFWAYFEIVNPKNEAVNILLESDYSVVDSISLYSFNEQGEPNLPIRMGDTVSYENRIIKYKNPVFNLKLKPGVNRFYVRMQTTSGVRFIFYLWDSLSFENFKLRESIFMGILFGGMVVLGFYNLFLAISLKSKTYGLYVWYIASYLGFSGSFYGIVPVLFGINMDAMPFTGSGSYFLIDMIAVSSCLFSIDFLGTKNRAPRIHYLLISMAGVAVLGMLINLVSGGTLPFSFKLTALTSLVLSVVLISSGIRVAFKGFTPARYYVLAWSCVLGGNIVLILAGAGVIASEFWGTWAQLTGATCEMTLLSLALGSKMNLIKKEKFLLERNLRKETEAKKLAQDELLQVQKDSIEQLDKKVREKTRDIIGVLTHIKQGIFTFRGDYKIMPEYSKFLESIVGSSDLKGRDIFDEIFNRSDLSADEIDKMKAILGSSIAEDELNWFANSEGLVSEISLSRESGKKHYLEIDWAPVLDDDGSEVDKVLVAIRDVTEIRKLKTESEAKDKKLKILLEILDQDFSKVGMFIERANKQALKIKSMLESYQGDEDVYNAIYREIHTIKGNARSLGLKKISDESHVFEDRLKNSKDQKAISTLIQEFQHFVNTIQEYAKTYHDKFKKLSSNSNLEPDTDMSFEHFVDQIIAPGIAKIAKILGKETPKLLVNDPDRHIMDDRKSEILQNILNHLARNSIDHGFEKPEERVALSKSKDGLITIDLSKTESGNIKFQFKDDGRGLDLSKIYQRALEKNLIDKDADLDEIINQIFVPGFSTAAKVSDISGRGVGMDAVNHYVEELRAHFTIEPMDQVDNLQLLSRIRDPHEQVFMPFVLVCEIDSQEWETEQAYLEKKGA